VKKLSARNENQQVWRARVERASRRKGTILEFCADEGVSREALRYWQRKLDRQPQRLPTMSPFISVEVLEPAPRRLPDARWVAELILHLQAGASQ
jgi:hypothetical protein